MSDRLPNIQPMTTPNPRSMKFLTDRTLVPSGSVDCRDPEAARLSPLAMHLFDLEGVEGVFLCQNFVTVSGADERVWGNLRLAVIEAMQQFLASGKAVLDEEALAAREENTDSDEVVTRIREILDQQIRPAVAMDGGDIVFVSFEDGILNLSMQGACGGCPSSTETLKAGIEARMRHLVPQVKSVEAVAG